MEQVTPAQLADWAKGKTQRAILLDVREGWEVQTASAKTDALDLVHMPMQTIPARLDELDKTRPIACLCHHGGRSMQVAMFLERQGYSNVYNLTGGVDAWARQVDTAMPTY